MSSFVLFILSYLTISVYSTQDIFNPSIGELVSDAEHRVSIVRQDEDCPDPLSCWLESLTFKIPDVCFMVENVECCITDFVCTGIEISGIDSSYIYPTTLSMELEGLGTPCKGEWSYGKFGGSISAVISNTDIATTTVVGKEDIYPVSLEFTTCTVPSIDIELKFSGGLVGVILQLISNKVEEGLEKAVYTVVCEVGEPLIANKTTEALVHTIDPALAEMVSHGPTPPPELPANTYIDWSTSLPGLMENIEEKHANDYLNKLVDSITNGTGSFHIDLHNTSLTFPVVDPTSGPLGNITLTLHYLDISGLDSFYDISLLTPSPPSPSYSPYSVWSAFSLHSFSISLGVTVDVVLDQGALSGGELRETFALDLVLSNSTIGVDLLLPVNIERLGELYLDQIADLSCLLSTADYLSVTSLILDTHIDSMTLVQKDATEDSLEKDIDDLINNIVELGVEGFPELLTDLISGVAQGPVKSLLNNKLSELLVSAGDNCIPHKETDDDESDWIVWSDSIVVQGLDYLLNSMIGPSGVNSIVDAATDGTGSVTVPLSAADFALTVFGLDSFFDFTILKPSSDPNSPYTLDSSVGLGYCEGQDRTQICTPVGISLVSDSDAAQSPSSASLTASFFNFMFSTSILTKFDLNAVKELRVADLFIFSGNHSGCFLSSFDEIAIESLDMSITQAELTKGPLVSKDITSGVEQLLNKITGEESIAAINAALVNLIAESAEACESGSWPPLPGDDDSPSPADDCDGPVQCALNSIVIGPLDDLCFDIKDSELEICIKAFSCYDIDLVGLESGNPDPQTILLGVEEFAITCGADWNISASLSKDDASNVGGHSLSYEGSVSIAMTDFTGSVEAAFGASSVSEEYPPMPASVKLQECKTSGTQFDIKFAGGVLGTILDKAVAPPLEDALESAVYWALCDLLNPFLSRVMTRVLKTRVDPAIEDVIDMRAPPAPVVMPGYLNWNETILNTVHNIISGIQVNEGKVIQCMLDAENPPVDGYNINTLIDFMTDGSGEFVISIDSTVPIGSATLTFETLTISGLDTFGDIFLLDPSPDSGVTLSSSIELASMDLQLAVLLEEAEEGYKQEAVVDLRLSNATLAFDMVAALRLSILNNLYSDQILHLPCIMSALDELYISSLVLSMNVENLSVQQVSGGNATSLELETAELVDSLFRLLLSGYPEMVTEMIEGIAQGPVKEKINEKLLAMMQAYDLNNADACPHHGNYSGVDWIVWSESTLIEKVDTLLNTLLGSDGVNKLMNCITDGTGNVVVQIPTDAPLLAGWKITLGGLNSFSDFALVYPVEGEPYDLGNLLGLGDCNSASDCNSFLLAMEGDHMDRHISIKLTMDNLLLYLDMLTEVDMTEFMNLQWAEFHTQGCMMTTVDALSIYDLGLGVSDVELYFNNGAGEVNLTAMVKSLLDKLTEPETLATFNGKITESLSTSDEVCAGTYEPTVDGSNSSDSHNAWRWQLAVLISGCIVALFLLVWIYFNYGVAGMSKTCMVDSKGVPYDGVGEEAASQYSAWDWEEEAYPVGQNVCLSNAWIESWLGWLFGYEEGEFVYDALIAQDSIYASVRILIPLAILGNIALFISGNIAVGATVLAEVDVGNQVIKPDPIFEFGLGNTVRDMWDAKVYPLSMLIAFFSGAWPYIKLVVMLFSWVLPTSLLPLPRRDSALIWLDILGKWSLIDTYVMVLMMVAFQFTLEVAPGIKVIVIVEPNWGFYAFLLATMCSLGLGHLVLACHRLIAETKIPPYELKTESLMNHTFTTELRCSATGSSFSTVDSGDDASKKYVWKTHQVSVTTAGKVTMVVVLLFLALSVIAGTFVKTFNFEFKGLTGYLMGDGAVDPYSLVTVGTTLPSASGSPHDFGVRWIQAAYFAFGLGMPLAFCAALLALWVTPLTLKFQKGFVVLTEVLNAWNALDVFVVSIIAALLEIQQFAAFLVGDNCDTINEILEEYMDDELDGDDKCFDVVATLKPQSWMLYLAASCLVIVGLPMMGLCHNVVAERMDEYESRKEDADMGSCHERSTSMSASRVPRLFSSAEERAALEAEESGYNALSGGESPAYSEGRDRILTVDLEPTDPALEEDRGALSSSALDLSGRNRASEDLASEDDGEDKTPWTKCVMSTFIHSCHRVGLVSFGDE